MDISQFPSMRLNRHHFPQFGSFSLVSIFTGREDSYLLHLGFVIPSFVLSASGIPPLIAGRIQYKGKARWLIS